MLLLLHYNNLTYNLMYAVYWAITINTPAKIETWTNKLQSVTRSTIKAISLLWWV